VKYKRHHLRVGYTTDIDMVDATAYKTGTYNMNLLYTWMR